jgi:acetylornithine deacetylase/succinyl-diaminopimelate desuccinylase-like protein
MRGVKRGIDSEDVATSIVSDPNYAPYLSDTDYADYLRLLKELISHRTVCTDEASLHRVITHCSAHFTAALAPLGWSIRRDAAGNLCCIPAAVDTSRPVLWLNAHVDTVDASHADFGGCDPFTCIESETHLIGRGANDCKAGVAFMMWYGEQLAKGRLPAFNGGFLVTRREEAGSKLPRTACQFASDLTSGRLPMSTLPRSTYIWILENTVSLATHLKQPVPEVAVYDRERHSLLLLCHGTLASLGHALLGLADHHEWKTVAIWPSVRAAGAHVLQELTSAEAAHALVADGVEKVRGGVQEGSRTSRRRIEPDEALERLRVPPMALSQHTHEGGHSCTVPNAGNRIFQCLVHEAVHASERCDGVELPPAALPAWASMMTMSAGTHGSGHGSAPAGGRDGGAGDGSGELEGTALGTALLWSGFESQPTRVASSVTSLPRSALPRSPAIELSISPAISSEPGVDRPSCGSCASDQEHTLVLNYRGLKSRTELEAQIQALVTTLGQEGLEWSAGSDLDSGIGAQQKEFILASQLPQVVEDVVESLNGAVTLKYEPNPGRSDASHLWRSLPEDLRGERVVPFTCGPGHRSHLCQQERVMRKTHGPNEGFHKSTGRATLPFFVELVRRFRLPTAKASGQQVVASSD